MLRSSHPDDISTVFSIQKNLKNVVFGLVKNLCFLWCVQAVTTTGIIAATVWSARHARVEILVARFAYIG